MALTIGKSKIPGVVAGVIMAISKLRSELVVSNMLLPLLNVKLMGLLILHLEGMVVELLNHVM